MSSAPDAEPALPTRVPRSRGGGGRHRRPDSPEVPPDGPALLLAVPGAASPESERIVEELCTLARAEQPGADIRFGFLEGEDHTLPRELARCAEARSGGNASTEAEANGGEADSGAGYGGADEDKAVDPPAIVVPLLAAPHPAVEQRVRELIEATGISVPCTSVLGPHPLLAEGLHVRLSEAGLSRADRARLFTVSTSTDGIVLATPGGEEAVQANEATGVLLAARLAVQVSTVSLDQEGAVANAVAQLREAGARQPVVAVGAVGPEMAPGQLAAATESVDCPSAEPLGAYPGVARLAMVRYTAALPIPAPAAG